MPTTYTPILDLNLPEIGASRDTWGALLNQNFTTLDTYVGMATPIGSVLDYAGPQAPSGWLICDGRAVSRTTYSVLFAVIGTWWGTGDGTSTFNLPNLNGRAGIGPGSVTDANGVSMSFTFASHLGWLSNPITQAQLPNYVITTTVAGYHSHGGATAAAGSHAHTTDAQGGHGHGGSYLPDHAHSAWTDAQGDHQHVLNGTWESPNGNRQRNTSFSGGFGELDNPVTSVAGNHAHNVGVAGAGNIGLAITWDGNHAHNVYAVGDHAHGIYGDGNHQHSFDLGGGGQWMGLMQPVLVVTKIIYAGQQAATSLAALSVDVPSTASLEEELATLREEMASIRALLAPATARVLRAPSRGMH